jgi:hypothetical protein
MTDVCSQARAAAMSDEYPETKLFKARDANKIPPRLIAKAAGELVPVR